MKQIIFNDYPSTLREDILAFSQTALSMFEQIKSELENKDQLSLYIGRISDTGINITPSVTNFFNITQPEKNQLHVNYLSDIHDGDEQRVKIEKIIRLDNPFGEIPILPGYNELPKFFLVGDGLESYKNFIDDARELLRESVGDSVQLCYKNDDSTYSVIHGVVREINKGNIFTEDYNEVLVIDNKSNTVNILCDRKKNHRFISQLGYLFAVLPPVFEKRDFTDDRIFGQDKLWNFS